jgi:glycosyltransferase involved in cell wall biosynthesis
MKIVALHTDFRIYWPARLKALAKALAVKDQSTLDVIEIAGEGSPYSFSTNNESNGLNWHILFPKSKPEELSGKEIKPKLFELLDRIDPDVIIAGAIAFPSGALAVQWGQCHPRCRIIIFDDAKNEAVKRNAFVNFVKRSVYSGVDAMFYPAEPWIPTGRSWGFQRDQLFFGVDVVDNDFWNRSQSLNKSWGNYFVAVGRQIPKKNFLFILNAYKLYMDTVGRTEAYNLILIGEGPEHVKLEQYIDSENLSEKIVLLPFMAQTELPAIYQHAKALCVCSDITETWGLVINEAMCGGCPIFASYECGASDVLVQQNRNGYKFHYYDIDQFGKYMVEFHHLPADKQSEMRETSKAIIADWGLERFSKGAMQAIEYVTKGPKKRIPVWSKLIINNWFGQYRPI